MVKKLTLALATAAMLGFAPAALAGEGSVDSDNFGGNWRGYGYSYGYPGGYYSGGVVLDPGYRSYGYDYGRPGVVYDDDYMTGYSPRIVIQPGPTVNGWDD